MRQHVSIVVHHANEPAKLFQFFGCLHLEDGIKLLLPWFEPSWGKPVTSKPACLLDGPFTFEKVDYETVVLQF